MERFNSQMVNNLFRYGGVNLIEGDLGCGHCPSCEQYGPSGKICLICVSASGVVLGDCNTCGSSGPIWENCEYCNKCGMHVSVYFGKCERCENISLGPVGSRCDNCLEGNFVLADEDRRQTKGGEMQNPVWSSIKR